MENEPELIRDQMQETRTALTEKLDSLQQKVTDTVDSITTPVTETVQTVKDAVAETVDSVKETVAGTVESVKDTFNVSRQVERNPWTMILGSAAAGFVIGRLLSPRRVASAVAATGEHVAAGMAQAANGFSAHTPKPARVQEEPSAGLSSMLGNEMDKLKSLGISVGIGLVRDLVAQSMHGEVGDRVRQFMDGVTEQLGGKPLAEPLVSPAAPEPANGRQPVGADIRSRW